MLLAQLQVQLAEARKEIKRFKEQNAALREQHTRATYTQSYTMESSTTVSTPPAALSQRQPHPTKKCLPFNRSYAKDCKAYMWSLSSESSYCCSSANQDFKYLYIPFQRRLPISQLRDRLHTLHTNRSRTHSTHYPDRNLAAIFIQNVYEAEFCSQLET
ncbi:hypothetical protein G6F37_000441 [Rhizopus arrhizus]|nr:hypothetical protein G6F38_002790 [Rhizopus arrhizus]KAG1164274.1 hypothetical protein G6F37_000441 [Rhizopus arrhizus]